MNDIILTRTNSNKDKLDEWFKESLSKVDKKPELSGALVGRKFQLDTFQKNDFKKAKAWLLDHNYPLDLIKGIIDFNIVDLANLLFEAESVAYNQDIYFKKLIERMDTASELIDIPNSINSPEDFCEWVRNYNGK